MRFVYKYRTKDNVQHRDVVCASDRESAFRALNARGIRPEGLWDAPGIINKILGKGKRWMLITLLAGVIIVLLVMRGVDDNGAASYYLRVEDSSRRQILGDAAVIDRGIKTGWLDLFQNRGDRFLASFAIPGARPAVRNSTSNEVAFALNNDVSVGPNDGIEAAQVKTILRGMKDELRAFLERGGTISEYAEELVKRQELEISYYVRATNEIEVLRKNGVAEDALMRVVDKRNDELRAMGIRVILFPE